MNEHIIFFDEKCPHCHRAVRHIVEIDEEEVFQFAPLRGSTATNLLIGPQEHLKNANSIVFVEAPYSTGRKFWSRFHAMLRIYWLIGNGWGLVGILSFLPQFVGDWFYNSFGAHRHQFTLDIPDIPYPKDRFLP